MNTEIFLLRYQNRRVFDFTSGGPRQLGKMIVQTGSFEALGRIFSGKASS
jgi:hypothetical protein